MFEHWMFLQLGIGWVATVLDGGALAAAAAGIFWVLTD